ncbi:MAG: GcrA family cell cycle regulator [Pseudomonadota bacterium]
MSWTDERVETLKTMWSEGKSASQIAKALGGVTRNAVIGKVHRLGLSNRTAAPKPAAGKPAPEETASPPPAAATKPAPVPQATPAKPEPVKAEPPAPAPAPVEARTPQPQTPLPPARPMSEVPEEARRNLEEVEKNALRLSLLQLTERTCKWPFGDPATDDFFFCGLPVAPGKPYCEACVAVAFQPMSARRDRARAR